MSFTSTMPNGYPQDWILGGDDIAKDISEDMVCSICSDLKRDAVITDCKHSFCGYCLMMWFRSQMHVPTCPHCRAPYSNTPLDPDVLMRAIIDTLQAKCPHCPFTDKLPSVFLHESVCASRTPDPPGAIAARIAHLDELIMAQRRQVQLTLLRNHDNGMSLHVELALIQSLGQCSCGACIYMRGRRQANEISNLEEVVGSHALTGLTTLRVVFAPIGKDYFFVWQFGQPSNVFIHMSTYTNIVRAIRSKYSCTDRTPITRPSPGDVVMGVLGQDGAGRLRVDGGATRLALRQ